MTTAEALTIILDMAHGNLAEKYHRLGRGVEWEEWIAEHEATRIGNLQRQAIKEVRSLLKSYEDNDYKDEDYMED